MGGGRRKFCIEGHHDVFLTWCPYDSKIKEDATGRSCSMYREENICLKNLGERILKEDTV